MVEPLDAGRPAPPKADFAGWRYDRTCLLLPLRASRPHFPSPSAGFGGSRVWRFAPRFDARRCAYTEKQRINAAGPVAERPNVQAARRQTCSRQAIRSIARPEKSVKRR